MEIRRTKRGWITTDETGPLLIDSDGYLHCKIEDGRQFKIKSDEVDLSDTLQFNVDGTDVIINLSKASNETDQTIHVSNEENVENEDPMEKLNFTWNDATTKLFLEIYKRKKDLVNTRKIKTYKILWKNIAEYMGCKGYSVTPLQIENKLKSFITLI